MISNLTLTPVEVISPRHQQAGPQPPVLDPHEFAFIGLLLVSERLEAGYHLRLGGRLITRLEEYAEWCEAEVARWRKERPE